VVFGSGHNHPSVFVDDEGRRHADADIDSEERDIPSRIPGEAEPTRLSRLYFLSCFCVMHTTGVQAAHHDFATERQPWARSGPAMRCWQEIEKKLSGPGKNTLVYNNTIYVGKAEHVDLILHTDWTGWAKDTYFYNNGVCRL
jgi:hypothetical protein